MNKEELDHFKTILLQKRNETTTTLEDIERTSRSATAQESSEERSTYSLHMADHGTDAMEREKSLFFGQREGDYLEYIDEALQRINDGSFGLCRVCGNTIGQARLEAVPTATQCIECKSKGETDPA